MIPLVFCKDCLRHIPNRVARNKNATCYDCKARRKRSASLEHYYRKKREGQKG